MDTTTRRAFATFLIVACNITWGVACGRNFSAPVGDDAECGLACATCTSDADCPQLLTCMVASCDVQVGRCTGTPVPNGTLCDDHDLCTLTSACEDGLCGGQVKDCSAISASCTVGQCNPETGLCYPEPLADGTLCDDSLDCTIADSCADGLCRGQARPCDDGDACTSEYCDEAQGGCVAAVTLDRDHDGALDASCAGGSDCDDLDPRRRPGAVDVCDGLDNDCDVGTVDGAADAGGACTVGGNVGMFACIDAGLLCVEPSPPPWYTWTHSVGVYQVNELSTPDGVNLWTVGWNYLLRSSDGGFTATVSRPFPSQTLTDIVFVSATEGWLVGYGGFVAKSFDGGDTWTEQTSGTTVDLMAVAAIDASTAWVVGASGVIRATIDGGETWTPQTSGTANRLNDVYARDADQVWAVGASGTILRTVTGGATWLKPASGTTDTLGDVRFRTDGLRGLVTSLQSCLSLSTVDGGVSWATTTTPAACFGNIEAIDLVGETTVWSASSFNLMRSVDAGATWTYIKGVDSDMIGIRFVDDMHGFVAGASNGILAFTFDAGSTWHRVPGATGQSLWGIKSYNRRVLWSWGKDAYISRDGGHTWRLSLLGSGHSISDILPTGELEAWATLPSIPSFVMHTGNGGASWEPLALPAGYVARAMVSLGSESLRLATQRDALLDTSDGGAHWQIITADAPITDSNRHVWQDSLRGWLLSGEDRLWRTLDGGHHWVELAPPLPNARVSDFCLSPEGRLFAAGDAGNVVRSDNAGDDWVAKNTGATSSIMHIRCPRADTAWAQTTSAVYGTDNGGDSWATTVAPSTQAVRDIDFPVPDWGWALRDQDVLFTQTGGQ